MHMAFLNAGTTDADELRFSAQFIDSAATGQPHARTQAAHLLVHDLFQQAFVGYAPFDTFWNQFIGRIIGWK